MRRIAGWVAVVVMVAAVPVGAQTSAVAVAGPTYERSEAMIPVRDGVKLHTVILRPAGSETAGPALPFLMQRTRVYLGVPGHSGTVQERGRVRDEPANRGAYVEEGCG
jgi:predicted acyl esterase